MALLVISVGLYSMISFGVSQRKREVGIRKALGASPGEIFGNVLKGSLRRLSIGTVLGLGAAWLLSRLLTGFLYDVAPGDWSLLLACLALLMIVVVPAAMLPAREGSSS